MGVDASHNGTGFCFVLREMRQGAHHGQCRKERDVTSHQTTKYEVKMKSCVYNLSCTAILAVSILLTVNVEYFVSTIFGVLNLSKTLISQGRLTTKLKSL